jgi:hypothetical protein
MREQDMRRRVKGFLSARLRKMVAPAALGLGLALGGCNGDALGSDDDGGADARDDAATIPDAATPQVKYMAQIPDAGPELPMAQPEYMTPAQDAGIFVRYGTPNLGDAGRDLGFVGVYMAQLPIERS